MDEQTARLLPRRQWRPSSIAGKKHAAYKLPENDARVTFIFETLQEMRKELQDDYDSSLAMFHDTPEKVFKSLLKSLILLRISGEIVII